MNRTLIGALNAVNNPLALAIILICTAMGFTAMQHSAGGLFGAVLGFAGGLVAAAVVCGLLALFIEIEKHLRQLVAGQEAARLDWSRQSNGASATG
jgi:hypothetical protein